MTVRHCRDVFIFVQGFIPAPCAARKSSSPRSGRRCVFLGLAMPCDGASAGPRDMLFYRDFIIAFQTAGMLLSSPACLMESEHSPVRLTLSPSWPARPGHPSRHGAGTDGAWSSRAMTAKGSFPCPCGLIGKRSNTQHNQYIIKLLHLKSSYYPRSSAVSFWAHRRIQEAGKTESRMNADKAEARDMIIEKYSDRVMYEPGQTARRTPRRGAFLPDPLPAPVHL